MVTIEVIPYKNFREKIRLTKELTKVKHSVIEIYNTYIYIEIGGTEDDRGYSELQRLTGIN